MADRNSAADHHSAGAVLALTSIDDTGRVRSRVRSGRARVFRVPPRRSNSIFKQPFASRVESAVRTRSIKRHARHASSLADLRRRAAFLFVSSLFQGREAERRSTPQPCHQLPTSTQKPLCFLGFSRFRPPTASRMIPPIRSLKVGQEEGSRKWRGPGISCRRTSCAASASAAATATAGGSLCRSQTAAPRRGYSQYPKDRMRDFDRRMTETVRRYPSRSIGSLAIYRQRVVISPWPRQQAFQRDSRRIAAFSRLKLS